MNDDVVMTYTKLLTYRSTKLECVSPQIHHEQKTAHIVSAAPPASIFGTTAIATRQNHPPHEEYAIETHTHTPSKKRYIYCRYIMIFELIWVDFGRGSQIFFSEKRYAHLVGNIGRRKITNIFEGRESDLEDKNDSTREGLVNAVLHFVCVNKPYFNPWYWCWIHFYTNWRLCVWRSFWRFYSCVTSWEYDLMATMRDIGGEGEGLRYL